VAGLSPDDLPVDFAAREADVVAMVAELLKGVD
jgi:hypothetical protein